jgi:hypothetical protein
VTADDVRAILKKACDEVGGIRAWSRKHDISAAYISDVILGRREPGPSVCRILGLEAVHHETTYRKVRR